ncbi:MAG: flagellin [Fervidobacterium sp.]|uniref:Flagellin n=1 Tax=Fervidobacterium gondwanense DSM 13020 TaxID=1121883 RepID=A0A1M7T6K7_FERGO|nr:flagellin [Fervidobacterium gondwanense]UXF01797.1 flagellin [Fervidobacterium riparium]SHN66336.1 flagellin [Fervidobacterium gondwanense DSM 13020]
MRINHNLSALNAWRQITLTDSDMKKVLERLSSGLKINRASDDAAGLAISEKMRGQIKGLDMAIKNSQDAISLIQTAEGALNEVHSILQRMRELAVQAASDTNTDVDRSSLQAEIDQLREEVDRIARTTEFNTKKLLNGNLEGFRATPDAKIVAQGNIDLDITAVSSAASVNEGTIIVEIGQFTGNTTGALDARVVLVQSNGVSTVVTSYSQASVVIGGVKVKWRNDRFNINEFGALPHESVIDTGVARVEKINTSGNQLVFQIGANEGANMIAGIDSMMAKDLGLITSVLKVTTQNAAERAISVIDAAIHKVSTVRSQLGAVQNRLEHTIANLGVAAENLTAAESRIRDADMAKEMMEFTKRQILLQSGMSMLAQSNAIPQNVLQLLRG